MVMNDANAKVFAYHEQSKNLPNRYARAPNYLDWASQPDPFRRYWKAPTVSLSRPEPTDEPGFAQLHQSGQIAPASLSAAAIGQLLYDSMALSAWKVESNASRPLRCVPSAGGLHPTEAYLLCGAVERLTTQPALYHYSAFGHSLELRAEFDFALWQRLCGELPAEETLLVGLTSIQWRTAWKYGERAYRYCQLELGHAMGAVSYAAAVLGWCAQSVPIADADLAMLLGIAGQAGPDAELPGCLIALYPRREYESAVQPFDGDCLEDWQEHLRREPPSPVSTSYREWPLLDEIAEACRIQQPLARPVGVKATEEAHAPHAGVGARGLLRQRRSALKMDGQTAMPWHDFQHFCCRLAPDRLPLNVLGQPPALHLLFFVHRVDGLSPGFYILPRSKDGMALLRTSLRAMPDWHKPEGMTSRLPLFELSKGDAQTQARVLSCNQAIASSGAFAVCMLAEFEQRLDDYGPGEYRSLHWEAGLLGQAMYMEAQALGLCGTAIGAFLDDGVHRLLGIADRKLQALYHFSVGRPMEDQRVSSLAAYHHLNKPVA
ncbi:MAG: SagB/ThcOx family dehydrogenase [Methylococcaceae bacterium]|nr:MAG: SagB/ThcOx family dehydrogenase [Methylococcaceae bacterium]